MKLSLGSDFCSCRQLQQVDAEGSRQVEAGSVYDATAAFEPVRHGNLPLHRLAPSGPVHLWRSRFKLEVARILRQPGCLPRFFLSSLRPQQTVLTRFIHLAPLETNTKPIFLRLENFCVPSGILLGPVE